MCLCVLMTEWIVGNVNKLLEAINGIFSQLPSGYFIVDEFQGIRLNDKILSNKHLLNLGGK